MKTILILISVSISLLLISCAGESKILVVMSSIEHKTCRDYRIKFESRIDSTFIYPKLGYFPVPGFANSEPGSDPDSQYRWSLYSPWLKQEFAPRMADYPVSPLIPDSVLSVTLINRNIRISISDPIAKCKVRVTNRSTRPIIIDLDERFFTPIIYRISSDEPSFLASSRGFHFRNIYPEKEPTMNDCEAIARSLDSIIKGKRIMEPGEQMVVTVTLDFKHPGNFYKDSYDYLLLNRKYKFSVQFYFSHEYKSIFKGIDDPDADYFIYGYADSDLGSLVVEDR